MRRRVGETELQDLPDEAGVDDDRGRVGVHVAGIAVMSTVMKLVSAYPLTGSSVLMNASAVDGAGQVAELGVELEGPRRADVRGADRLLAGRRSTRSDCRSA